MMSVHWGLKQTFLLRASRSDFDPKHPRRSPRGGGGQISGASSMDARRTPKQIVRAHLPDQHAQFCLDLRSPSPSTRFPTPIAAKASPMPTHQRFGSNNHENRKDRREPAIELDEEPAVVVREASPAFQLASQDDHLMSKHCILRLKPDVRLEWRGQHGQNEADQRDHRANLADSIIR